MIQVFFNKSRRRRTGGGQRLYVSTWRTTGLIAVNCHLDFLPNQRGVMTDLGAGDAFHAVASYLVRSGDGDLHRDTTVTNKQPLHRDYWVLIGGSGFSPSAGRAAWWSRSCWCEQRAWWELCPGWTLRTGCPSSGREPREKQQQQHLLWNHTLHLDPGYWYLMLHNAERRRWRGII